MSTISVAHCLHERITHELKHQHTTFLTNHTVKFAGLPHISADGGQGGGRDEARGRLGKDTLCEGRRAGGETNRDCGAGLVIIFN